MKEGFVSRKLRVTNVEVLLYCRVENESKKVCRTLPRTFRSKYAAEAYCREYFNDQYLDDNVYEYAMILKAEEVEKTYVLPISEFIVAAEYYDRRESEEF